MAAETDVPAIVQRVQKSVETLNRHDVSDEDIAALTQVLEELQQLIDSFGSQRVLELSSSQMTQAGAELYNAPRAAIRALVSAEKTKNHEEAPKTFPRYLLVNTRLLAAKIMELSLDCPKRNIKVDGVKRGGEFLGECIDVLRCFGRVGMLMLDSASIDCGRCEVYLTFAKEAFETSLRLWSRIGLSHLTKFKEGFELEEIIDDLWDVCTSRVRALRLLTKQAKDAREALQDIVASLHELKMLAPYKSLYADELLALMRGVSDGYNQEKQHELQTSFVEEALGVCDSLEHGADEKLTQQIVVLKQHVLENLLWSLCADGDIERAEMCYQLIPSNLESKVLLAMVNLYVDNNKFEKARHMLTLLFQQNNLDDAILGARSYAQGLSFSEEGVDIYRELLYNYGDSEFQINLEIACDLALDENKQYQALAEIKRLGLLVLEKQRNGEAIDTKIIGRIRQTVFDAVHRALNANHQEDCLKWAEVGLAVTATAEDKALYMRTLSRSCLRLGRAAEATAWAEKAYTAQPSKKSLFVLFQAELHTKRDDSVKLVKIIDQMKTRVDFETEDLLALGKQVHDLGPDEDHLQLYILDELCQISMQDDDCSAKIPKGVVLQNAAQLALKCTTHQQTDLATAAKTPYSEKFMAYAAALLSLFKPGGDATESCVGPAAVCEWFYCMSVQIAKTTQDSRYYVLAADIAEQSNDLYENLPQCRCKEALLWAAALDFDKIDSLDTDQLCQLIEIIARYESIADGNDDDENLHVMAKAAISAKIRIFDPDTERIFDDCKTKLKSHIDDFIEFGQLVLFVTKFKEAKMRDKYHALSRQLFSYSLQLLFQADSVDTTKLSSVLRRIIELANSQALALEWFQQVLQICASLDVVFREVDMEWFVAKAWNFGVLCLRSNDLEKAQKFMKIALAILEQCESLTEKLGHDLHEQYQSVLEMGSINT